MTVRAPLRCTRHWPAVGGTLLGMSTRGRGWANDVAVRPGLALPAIRFEGIERVKLGVAHPSTVSQPSPMSRSAQGGLVDDPSRAGHRSVHAVLHQFVADWRRSPGLAVRDSRSEQFRTFETGSLPG